MRLFSVLVLLCGATACDDTIFPSHGTNTPLAEGWCGVRSVFSNSCAGCHSAGAALGGLDLETDPHAAIVGVESAAYPGQVLVVAGDPEGSFLYRKIADTLSSGEGAVMPPTGALTPSSVTIVSDWISAGAEEVACSGGTTPQGVHPDGWDDPGVHGLAAKLQTFADCRSCHGADLAGGTAGVACDSCHAPDWETTCTYCHGGLETDGGAPPEDIDDQADSTLLTFNAHTTHVTETNSAARDCTTCHTKPTSALTPGHLFDDNTPGVAEVDFGGGLSAAGTYAGNGSCSNLYCHGTGLVPGSANDDQPALTCHSCHPDWTSPESAVQAMSGDHKDHIEDITCSECHGSVVNPSRAIIDPLLHVNGVPDTQFPVGFVFADNKCTGACHGESHTNRVW